MGCVGNRKVLENITRSLEHNPLRTKHFPIPRTPTTTTLLFNNNKNPQKGKNNIFSVWENKWDESYEFFTFALFFFAIIDILHPSLNQTPRETHTHTEKNTHRESVSLSHSRKMMTFSFKVCGFVSFSRYGFSFWGFGGFLCFS